MWIAAASAAPVSRGASPASSPSASSPAAGDVHGGRGMRCPASVSGRSWIFDPGSPNASALGPQPKKARAVKRKIAPGGRGRCRERDPLDPLVAHAVRGAADHHVAPENAERRRAGKSDRARDQQRRDPGSRRGCAANSISSSVAARCSRMPAARNSPPLSRACPTT